MRTETHTVTTHRSTCFPRPSSPDPASTQTESTRAGLPAGRGAGQASHGVHTPACPQRPGAAPSRKCVTSLHLSHCELPYFPVGDFLWFSTHGGGNSPYVTRAKGLLVCTDALGPVFACVPPWAHDPRVSVLLLD